MQNSKKSELIEQIKQAKERQDWKKLEQLQEERLLIEPDSLRALADIAMAAKKQGKWEKVKSAQERRLELDPQNVKAMSDLAQIARDEGNWKEVIRLQEKIVALEPENLRAMFSILTAVEEMKKNQTEQNQEESFLIEEKWLRRIWNLLQNDDFQKNFKAEIIKSYKITTAARLVTAVRRKGDLEETEKWQRVLVNLQPDNADAIIKLVTTLKKQGKWEEIEELQKRVLEIRPNDQVAISDLISVAKKQENWEKVRKLQEKRPAQNKISVQETGGASEKKSLTEQDIEQISDKLTQTDSIAKLRGEIREETINIARANEIIEELKQKGGVRANVLIAEIQARVMGLPEVSARFLKTCQKTASTDSEKKAYTKAIEILRQSRTMAMNKLEEITEPEER